MEDLGLWIAFAVFIGIAILITQLSRWHQIAKERQAQIERLEAEAEILRKHPTAEFHYSFSRSPYSRAYHEPYYTIPEEEEEKTPLEIALEKGKNMSEEESEMVDQVVADLLSKAKEADAKYGKGETQGNKLRNQAVKINRIRRGDWKYNKKQKYDNV